MLFFHGMVQMCNYYVPVGPSGPVQDPAVIGNFFVLCLFFIEFNVRLLRSAVK